MKIAPKKVSTVTTKAVKQLVKTSQHKPVSQKYSRPTAEDYYSVLSNFEARALDMTAEEYITGRQYIADFSRLIKF